MTKHSHSKMVTWSDVSEQRIVAVFERAVGVNAFGVVDYVHFNR